MSEEKKVQRTVNGRVVSAKMQHERLIERPVYGKYIRRTYASAMMHRRCKAGDRVGRLGIQPDVEE